MHGLLFSILIGVVVVAILGYNGYDLIRNIRRDHTLLEKRVTALEPPKASRR